MKYIVVLGDGMGGRPIEALGGKTTLEAAKTPYMDRMAREGECGILKTLIDGYPMGSDVANLTVLGYEPRKYYTGRSPLEALGLELDIGEKDLVLRANLVNISESDPMSAKMVDHSSDKITDAEALELVEALQAILPPDMELYAGASYRNILVWHNYLENYDYKLELAPPHDILEQDVKAYLPAGNGADVLWELTQKSVKLLESHPVNLARAEKGLKMANCLWMWGDGTRPMLDSFEGRYGLKGAMVTAVPLLEGIAFGTGMKKQKVANVTGDIHTNFEGKANAAIDALKNGFDFAFLHMEAPDECGHDGNAAEKVESIEYVDGRAVKIIFDRMAELEDEVKILLLPDHATPIEARTHTADEIPYVIWSNRRELPGHAEGYSEKAAKATGIRVEDGTQILKHFLSL
ncbi:MAG: cofactor-independent phosphoglycerate mutase [Ruminococcaceae bacterium]|nr:cofactor-independent phosphoglycerate mutase [Oscillospiraceae bacterium]